MHVSMWSFPWDLVDLGIDYALKDMKDNGITGLSLITSYHAGRFLQIRSPIRKIYFPEDGVLYYPSDLSRFDGQLIQPVTGTFIRENPSFWDDVFNTAARLDMTISGWTVCLHNTRIGTAYPGTCVHNAYGDVVYFNQCPSNPDVRLYMNTLIDDLCSGMPWYSLELESMNYLGHAHGFHHEKDGIGLTAVEDFLLSLCFCDSCEQRAKSEGLDILPAKTAVKKLLETMCQRDLPQDRDMEFLKQGFDFFADIPELAGFLRWRSTVVTTLVQEVAQTAAGRIKLYFMSLLPHSCSWLFGVDLKQISGLCDGVVICSYKNDTPQAVADLRESRRDFSPGTKLIIGMRTFYPEYSGIGPFREKVLAAKAEKVDGFNFYNYGLIPKVHLQWIKESLTDI